MSKSTREENIEKAKTDPPGPGGCCQSCGHFAARHGPDGCKFPRNEGMDPCPCKAFVWHNLEWPRPWQPYPDGTNVAGVS